MIRVTESSPAERSPAERRDRIFGGFGRVSGRVLARIPLNDVLFSPANLPETCLNSGST
jgi:hypothetical protein